MPNFHSRDFLLHVYYCLEDLRLFPDNLVEICTYTLTEENSYLWLNSGAIIACKVVYLLLRRKIFLLSSG